jgi:hypothetical protein
MAKYTSVYAFLANMELTFKIPFADDSQLDPFGNPQERQEFVTLKAYMRKVDLQKAPLRVRQQFDEGINAFFVNGYLTEIVGALNVPLLVPDGIAPGDKSVSASYSGKFLKSLRTQTGTFIYHPELSSSVGADSLTGEKLSGILYVVGGE